MNRSDSDKMTPFDRLVSSRQLQLLKLLIPYVPAKKQRMLAIYTKFMELEYTIQFFRHVQKDIHSQAFSSDISSPFDIFDELRPYLPEEEQNRIDSFLNIWNMIEMFSAMETMTGDGNKSSDTGNLDPMNLMKELLSPEQQEMFETYSEMFQESKQSTESDDSKSKGELNNG